MNLIIFFLKISLQGETILVLSKELIATLDKWEQEELRDFVRRRGTPILERVPIESIEKTDDGMLDFNMLPQGGMVNSLRK